MPFDHVPIDQRRVARRRPFRNTMFRFESSELWILRDIDAGSEVLQVPDPLSATPSARFLMHLKAESGQIGCGCLDRWGGRYRRRRSSSGGPAARGHPQHDHGEPHRTLHFSPPDKDPSQFARLVVEPSTS